MLHNNNSPKINPVIKPKIRIAGTEAENCEKD